MNLECHYCDSPTITVSEPASNSKKGSFGCTLGYNGANISASMGTAETYKYVQSKLKIDCMPCDRCYYLEADSKKYSSHERYVENFVTTAFETTPEEKLENLSLELCVYGINIQDVISGAYAITIPVKKGILNKIFAKAVKKFKGFQFHILFIANGIKYYMVVHKNVTTGKLTVTHIENLTPGSLNDIHH
ncbi:hypothetical protein HNP93_000986 [Methanococcus maripaludis]|uniref:Uncharacterized protein n=1 Tax=Methanococcus maripaludis TaxID=39152 RepID=A0A7J9P529_METMI|nr:hypothetical protein [Methanococcus maripaludis]MBA2858285.1 hypothetical protein [Methanococcus maripaludis]